MLELLKAAAVGLATLLPLANPLTTVALMMGLSRGMDEAERNRQALKASIYVFAIMMVAYYTGQLVMNVFGISITGLRIAGGLIVAFIGFRMLFPQQRLDETPEVERRGEELRQHRTEDIAFIPLAMPSTAGPGTIALIISTAAAVRSERPYAEWVMLAAPPLVFFLAAAILLLCLRSSGTIMRKLGNSGVEAFSRLMGFLLVCIGVQFVINGIYEVAAEVQALLSL
ncbi:MarC family NAAT transporter [Pseudoxanthomonas koreensis]|uniref:MarC family NAAT transporter n=1 Tax=Pseudoxanthomonas koreensis TaxID=266061 RepID=UPI0013914519|nr:MarC family NAAT transporter [Pseudoxanthomonas koreensis]KAF1697179.1 stress protection protein MarC [Pseudoxanthomonas koreensis]